jgi:hypothetical protein
MPTKFEVEDTDLTRLELTYQTLPRMPTWKSACLLDYYFGLQLLCKLVGQTVPKIIGPFSVHAL